jgi:hypothetical protein
VSRIMHAQMATIAESPAGSALTPPAETGTVRASSADIRIGKCH